MPNNLRLIFGQMEMPNQRIPDGINGIRIHPGWPFAKNWRI
jgi:hypothetical protein